MPSVIIEFPFDSGQNEAADFEQVAPGLTVQVENGRLDRDGRLGVRPGNTQLASTTHSANALTAYDLANYNGRLVALGDQTAQGRPTDLFEFTNDAVGAWRATAESDVSVASGQRIPRATAARETGRIPDLDADVQYVSTATDGSGIVCAAFQLSNNSVRVHAYNPATDQTLLLGVRFTVRQARVIWDGTHFWIVGQDTSSNAIIGLKYTPSTDKSLTTSPTSLVAAPGGVLVDLALAQTGASDFTIAYIPAAATSVVAARFNNAGTLQSTFNVATALTSAGMCACAGNSGGTRLLFAYGAGGSPTRSYSLVTTSTTGTGSVGPTSLFSGNTVTGWCRVACIREGTVYSLLGMRDSGTTNSVVAQTCTDDTTNALTVFATLQDTYLQAGPIGLTAGGTSQFYFGASEATASAASQGTNQLFEQTQFVPQCQKDPQLVNAFLGVSNFTGSISKIGTKVYWGNIRRGILPTNLSTTIPSSSSGTVTELEMGDTGRRQMSSIGNELLIAGALPLCYDGTSLASQGFAEKPFVSLAQTTGGSLTLLGVYNVVVVYEIVDSRGNILRSQPSDPAKITLTGANNAITATSTAPHDLHNHPILQTQAGYSVRIGFYVTQAGGGTFQIDQYVAITAASAYGGQQTATIVSSDASRADNAPLYTQEQTPIPHVAPQPYRYSWPTRERLAVGGLPSAEQVVHSKLLFPTEPVEWAPAGQLGFTSRLNEDITAIGAFETVTLAWTKREVAMIPGRGPESDGTGDFDSPLVIPSPGGCSDWRSVILAPPGFFFQMLNEKLMLLTRASSASAGEVSWVGQPVRDTLALFPVVTGAVHVRSQMIVAFSITNQAGNDGRILVYDLRRNLWYVDTVGPVSAISELDGRLAYVQSGSVFYQDAAPGNGAFPTLTARTGMFPIVKRLGWGHVYEVGLLGTDLGACTIEAFIDTDDGNGFVSLGQEVMTGSGNSFEKFWSVGSGQTKTPRLAVKFVVTGGSNTLGVSLKSWALTVEASKNMARIGSASQVA